MNDVVVWTGWLAGIAIGLYGLFQFWISNRQLGCSLAYGNFIGFCSKQPYFHQGHFKELNNWRLWFIIGIPLGGFIAALSSPEMEMSITWNMGVVYEKVMPESNALKALVVTLGGIFMGVGARMAGGCTSGHVIAGGAMLNPPSLFAGVLFFLGGLMSVQLLFLLFL